MVTQESKTKGEMLSESKNHFQAILQLLQLVVALLPEDEHKNHSDKLNHGTRDTHDKGKVAKEGGGKVRC